MSSQSLVDQALPQLRVIRFVEQGKRMAERVLLARKTPATMSAVPTLLEYDRTNWGDRRIEAIDPKANKPCSDFARPCHVRLQPARREEHWAEMLIVS